MNKRYQNHMHYFYYCRKITLNNGVDVNEELKKLLLEETNKLYCFNEENVGSIHEYCLRQPVNVFSFRLSKCVNGEETKALLMDVDNIIKNYISMLELDKQAALLCSEFSKYGKPFMGVNSIRQDASYKDKVSKATLELSEKTLEILMGLFSKSGLYKLYDSKKELLYIGKSYDLGRRIATSSGERKARYFAYSLLSNKSDTDIYELYYIATLKPPANSSGVNDDLPTIKLPGIKFTKPRPLYKNAKGVV